jgi:hypothetical protein
MVTAKPKVNMKPRSKATRTVRDVINELGLARISEKPSNKR